MVAKLPAAEGLILSRLRWDFFLTLTHAPVAPGGSDGAIWSQPSVRLQQARWRVWCNEVVKKLRINENSFRWVKRTEVGRGGRDHFHALVNFHKFKLVNKTTKFFLGGIWSGLGYGFSNSRTCGEHGASEYITKIQNEYEMDRFGSERYRHVEFSKSAMKAFRRSAKGIAVHTGY